MRPVTDATTWSVLVPRGGLRSSGGLSQEMLETLRGTGEDGETMRVIYGGRSGDQRNGDDRFRPPTH